MNKIESSKNISQSKKIIIFADQNYYTLLPRNGVDQIYRFSEEDISFSNVSKNLTVYIVASSVPLREFNNNNYQDEHRSIELFANKNCFKKIDITSTTYLFIKPIIIKK